MSSIPHEDCKLQYDNTKIGLGSNGSNKNGDLNATSIITENKTTSDITNLQDNDLNEAIEKLVAKRKLNGTLSNQDQYQLKRLRNIQGSRTFRKNVKKSKQNFKKADVNNALLKSTIAHLKTTENYVTV